MKEVKIIEIKAHQHFAKNTYDEIDDVIEHMYRNGFEYKGFVPSEIFGYGSINVIKLIFDREY